MAAAVADTHANTHTLTHTRTHTLDCAHAQPRETIISLLCRRIPYAIGKQSYAHFISSFSTIFATLLLVFGIFSLFFKILK